MVGQKPREKTKNSDSSKTMMGARVARKIEQFRRFLRGILLAIVILGAILILSEVGDSWGLRLPWWHNRTVSQVSARVVPAVVTITSLNDESIDPEEALSLGSGVVVDSRGFIVTNYHVIARGRNFKVHFEKGMIADARLVGFDRLTDLAVLKVSVPRLLPFVNFGNSQKTRVGDRVVTVGNPFGVGTTVTSGIISARGRRLSRGESADYLQIDATINQGNSGGPLFNLKAQVIGINTAIIAGESGGWSGVGFSLASDTVKPVVAQIIKTGRVHRGWQGVWLHGLPRSLIELPEAVLPEIKGAHSQKLLIVSGVVAGSPAAESELMPGDIVLKINGEPVTTETEAQIIIRRATIGKIIPWQVFRAGQKQTIKIKVAELPDSAIGETNSEE